MGLDAITVNEAAAALITAASIPSALMGFLMWRFQHGIKKRDQERERLEEVRRTSEATREAARKKLELLIVQGTNAALALAEATALALERIPDMHCNGEMHQALQYATNVKHDIKNFLEEQGVKAVVS